MKLLMMQKPVRRKSPESQGSPAENIDGSDRKTPSGAPIWSMQFGLGHNHCKIVPRIHVKTIKITE
jgi:hypothetical protein